MDFSDATRPTSSYGLRPVLRAIHADGFDERAWVRLTDWLAANDLFEEAEAVQTFWPVIANAVQAGLPLGRALALLSQQATGLTTLARRLGRGGA